LESCIAASRFPNKQWEQSAKTVSEILKLRQFNIMQEFKLSLQEHQKAIQKQEAKREKLVGGGKLQGPKKQKQEASSTTISFSSKEAA